MKLLTKIIKYLSVISILNSATVFAWGINYFEVTLSPGKAKTWEALDITIEAKDKNDNTVTDYDWSILVFSESDPEAEFPNVLEENSYNFKIADEWKVKFENAVKFKNAWNQDIHVYDLNDDSVLWIAEASIIKEEKQEKLEIILLSPEEGITIWEKTVIVSWNTQKNHQVKIVINNSNEIKTTSNSEWVFESKVENLEDWESKIKAVVLNSDEEIVWESKEVTIKIDASSPRLKSLKVSPKEKVESESELEVELISNKWLTEVSLIINDTLTKLEEEWEGVYKWKIVAPEKAWDYKVDVILKDELWHETKELWVEIISVKEIELEAAEEPKKEEPKEEPKEEEKDLQIKWLKLTKLKTKSVLTWDEVKEVEWYNVYKKLEDWTVELVENVKEPRFEIDITWDKIRYDYFAVKAVAKTASWEIYEWDLSEATKIQTGPEIWILLILSMLIWWLIFFTKKRA